MKKILLSLLLIICSGISGCEDYTSDHTEIQSSINLSAQSSVIRIKPKSKKLQRILDKVIIAPKIEGEYITAVKYASYVTYYPPFLEYKRSNKISDKLPMAHRCTRWKANNL